MAVRDLSNGQWQTDLAFSCAKLGALPHGQTQQQRRDHLLRGREILTRLKSANRLPPNQDWISWFDQQLTNL